MTENAQQEIGDFGQMTLEMHSSRMCTGLLLLLLKLDVRCYSKHLNIYWWIKNTNMMNESESCDPSMCKTPAVSFASSH